jgi:hypothetical protein
MSAVSGKYALIAASLCFQLLAVGRPDAQLPSSDPQCALELAGVRRQIFFSIIQGITTLPQMDFGGLLLGSQALLEARAQFPLEWILSGTGNAVSTDTELISVLAQVMDTAHEKLKIPHFSRARIGDFQGAAVVDGARLSSIAGHFSRRSVYHISVLVDLAMGKNPESLRQSDENLYLPDQVPAKLQALDPAHHEAFEAALRANRLLADAMSTESFLHVAKAYQVKRAAVFGMPTNYLEWMAEIVAAFQTHISVEPNPTTREFAQKILDVYWDRGELAGSSI